MSLMRLLLTGILFWLASCIPLEADRSSYESDIPDPLIIVPGDAGSRAYSEIKIFGFHYHTLLWVNFVYMTFPIVLRKYFSLKYDPRTHKTYNVNDSDVYFPGWGSTETIEQLDDRIHYQTIYFSNLVNELVKDKFYVRNKTIRGAPYDFRKAPNENENFTSGMKSLVEETYRISGNQRVVILGHSMGSLYTLFFLKNMPVSWKKKYIRSFVSVSGPLAGAVKAVSTETSGDSIGSIVSPIHFRTMERTFPSTTFLLPKPEIFGKTPIVITPKRNYSAYDYEALFNDMSMPYGMMMYNDTKNLVNGAETPTGIDELYCIHSYGRKTKRQLVFTSFPDEQPYVIFGDGDGTVNIESLKLCQNWKNVHYYTMKNYDHMKIVTKPEFIDKMKQILYGKPIQQRQKVNFKNIFDFL